MTVFVSSQLSSVLAAISPSVQAALVSEFTRWKGLSDEFASETFCNSKCESLLHHVHMRPSPGAPEEEAWNRFWRNKHLRHKRRSNRYLLYAEHIDALGRKDYLLIAILNEDPPPGAHGLWTSAMRSTLRTLQGIAEDFAKLKSIP